MNANSSAAFAAALASAVLAVAALMHRFRAIAGRCFIAGMATLAIECGLIAMGFHASSPEEAATWQTRILISKVFLSISWLGFSVAYSRGNYREFLRKWRWSLLLAFALPAGMAYFWRNELYNPVAGTSGSPIFVQSMPGANALNLVLLVAFLAILMNLEKTFRAAVGTMRWRIKYVILGLGLVFGARAYTQSQALLFSIHDRSLGSVDAGALLIGSVLISVGCVRSGFKEVDIYPASTVMERSATLLLVGGYLFLVGVLAQGVRCFGGMESFQSQAFLVLLVGALAAVLIASERLRQRIKLSISRTFHRPQYDSRSIWKLANERMSEVLDRTRLCEVAAKLMSEKFNILSVTIWLLNDEEDKLVLASSTASARNQAQRNPDALVFPLKGLRGISKPFDLDECLADWAEPLRNANPQEFRRGGNRLGIPLLAGEKWLGIAILGDRVNGVRYSVEELDLLECIGSQTAAALLNLQLSGELLQGKELEAFQTMSAFFVHDLKNAASSLDLMLKNLPIHFDDPEFRQDALRGIANTSSRINEIVGRLSLLRNKLELKFVEVDLVQLADEALKDIKTMPNLEVVKDFRSVPNVHGDREHLHTVMSNLLLNAVDAVGSRGRIKLGTREADGRAVFSIADDGCGMTDVFVKTSLFRPFHTTKQKGLGIGMFQSKVIVEAHRGDIHVQSIPGKGTTFSVSLPCKARI